MILLQDVSNMHTSIWKLLTMTPITCLPQVTYVDKVSWKSIMLKTQMPDVRNKANLQLFGFLRAKMEI